MSNIVDRFLRGYRNLWGCCSRTLKSLESEFKTKATLFPRIVLHYFISHCTIRPLIHLLIKSSSSLGSI